MELIRKTFGKVRKEEFMQIIDFKLSPFVIRDYNEDKMYPFSSYEGMLEWLKKKLGTPDIIDTGKVIATKVLAWVGKEFRAGQKEQCCYFVREVLNEAGLSPGVTKSPSDKYLPTGEGYANSLAGDDIGKKISRKDLLPGDLVFFKNTYGEYPEGTITHIGIYTGDGYFVHRSTSAKPVEKLLLDSYYSGTKFIEGRRVK